MRPGLLLTALALAAGCSGTRPSGSGAAPTGRAPRLPVIDAHVHATFDGEPERTSGIPVTRERFLRELDEAGVVAAVSHQEQDGAPLEDFGKEGLAPGGTGWGPARRVIHCAAVTDSVDAAALEAGLKAGTFRCVKVYLGYAHRFASDPVYQPVYRLAGAHGVPVVFHTGDTYSAKGKLKYADPLTVDEVAVDHPTTTFVLAHCGNPWIQSAAEVAYKNPNVYLDGSAFLIGDLDALARKDPGAVEEYLVKPLRWVFHYVEDPRKLMFGSDWPLASIAAYRRAFERAIPKEHWKAVFHDNAARVFGLEKTP